MISTRTISLRETLLATFRNVIHLKAQLVVLLAILFSINGFAQTISIGSPNDGTEGGSPMSFIVSLDNGVINNTGADITGTITVIGGTATAGTDFLTPISFAISNGSNSIGVLMPIVDDAFCEGTESATFQISNPNVGSVNPAASTVTTNILDDDCASQLIVSIDTTVSTATEGTTTSVDFIVSLDNGAVNNTGTDITGTLTFTGTTTNLLDYIVAGTSTFTIPNGASSGIVTVTIVDDAICEATETLTVTITSVSSGLINPTNDSATITIFDDDFCYVISISSSVPSAVEGTSDIVFDISIISGGPNNSGAPITGSIGYAGGATSPSDFIAVTSYSIPVGASSTTVTVTVVDDAIAEPTEPLTIFLTGSPSVGSYGNTTTTTSIIDDDAASLAISIGSPVDGTEGGAFVTYTVSLDGGVINNSGSAITGVINYTGTATDGVDHTGIGTFTIPDGVGATLVPIPIIDDTLIECSETIIATISNPSIGAINIASATANIIDDECSQFTISIGSPVDGAEGGGDASFVIAIDGGGINNTGSAIIGAMAFFGDAAAAFDYTPSATAFSIPDGQNSTTITLSVIDDACIEFTESASITISNPSVGAINNSTETANIIDNDSGAALISIGSPVDGEEALSDVSFDISIDGGLTNCTGAPITGTVSYSGTATAGVDYSDVVAFAIPDGATFITLVLPVIDDILDECDETVIATISSPSVGAINSGASSSTAIIVDDECTNSIDPLSDFGLQIYPNPINSVLYLLSEQQMKNYSLVDLNGRMVEFGDVNGTEMVISTVALSAGSYIVQVEFDNGRIVRKKILKE
jgi:hypothetical protein